MASWAIVKQVTPAGQEEYFDFHVPFYENYWCGGLFHHNCGKTTIARILRDKLNCVGSDYREVDCAQDGSIETIREIQQRVSVSPLYGKTRIWFFEEAQALSKTGFAQQAMLRLLENAPRHCRFVLATTDPSKLHRAIITRCLEIKLEPVPDDALHELITRVCRAEKLDLSRQVADKLVELAGGSARQLLQDLQKVASLKTEEEKIAVLEPPAVKKQAFDLVRALIWQRAKWPQVLAILKQCPIEDTEQFRHLVLACANTELMKGGATSHRAWQVIEAWKFPLWDFKEAAIAAICYQLTGDGK